MRYVTLNNASAGMILGKPFYGRFGELMLQEGMILTEALLVRMRELKLSGIYIKDKLSEDIEIDPVITDELRYNTVNAVRRLILDMNSKNKKAARDTLNSINDFVDKIIDDICNSDHIIYNIQDIKVYDLYTYQHSVNVCVLSCVIGAALNLTKMQMRSLAMAAVLHDLGKTFISKEILNKPGKLNTEEFTEIKKHSFKGYEYIKDKFNFRSSVHVAVLQHHERHDGTGYPHGRKGSEIISFARIIAIADVFDAITSKRPYHDAILPSEAYEYILGNAGQHFDPELVDVFSKKIAPFPLGIMVRLSNGQEGIVYENYPDYFTRPLIKLTSDNGGFVDLRSDPDAYSITIKEIIS